MTRERILELLARVTFAPSCVDMAWAWEVVELFTCSGTWAGAEGDDYDRFGFALRTTFRRPDRDTGEIARGFGRWWHVPADVAWLREGSERKLGN